MELSQVEPVKLVVGYDSGQTLTFTIKTLRRFLLHSQPGTNGEVEKLLNITVEYTEVIPGREVVHSPDHHQPQVNQPVVTSNPNDKSLNGTADDQADLEMLAANLVKSYQTGSLDLLAAELLLLLTGQNREEVPRIRVTELASLIVWAAHIITHPERASTEISGVKGEAGQKQKRRSYHFEDELDRGPDGVYLKLLD